MNLLDRWSSFLNNLKKLCDYSEDLKNELYSISMFESISNSLDKFGVYCDVVRLSTNIIINDGVMENIIVIFKKYNNHLINLDNRKCRSLLSDCNSFLNERGVK